MEHYAPRFFLNKGHSATRKLLIRDVKVSRHLKGINVPTTAISALPFKDFKPFSQYYNTNTGT